MEAVELRPGWAVKAIMIIIIASVLLRCVSAANLTVGGPSGWDMASNIHDWALTTTFYVGDFLVFSYSPVHDVLEVNRGSYTTCRTVNPIKVYTDGETTVPLTETGTRYFICGRRGHCGMGLRLLVDVLPQRAANENDRFPRRSPRHHSPPPSPITHSPPPVHPPSLPPDHPPPPSPSHEVPPLPDIPPFDVPPPASPCESSSAGGTLHVDYYNWWVWVPLVASIISIISIYMPVAIMMIFSY